MSPFEIVYGQHPRKPVDLIPLPMHSRTSESAESLAQHIRDLHKDIIKKLNISNQIYKQLADSHRRTSDLAEGDYVMIRKRFPSGTVKKLHARGAGSFKILKKIGSNAFVVDLPPDFGISSTFNISDLVKYKKPITIPSEPFEPNPSFESEPLPECPRPKFSKKHDRIERILDEQIISTRRKGYQRYLVRWHGRPESDDTWITREELQQIDPDILEHYQSQTQLPSTELNFPQSGRIGGDTNEPASLWLDC
ncbi:uncharacterized protein LOC113461018 [Phoenix dactylifera]|uniref:Uncharacterized protein LOC113461018 n=1 Tax=Phoenix dactylifera TaxID=42345 RepID=A0A8B8IYB2_PHODC|nr:uncharacterized protein LOC113461018 [Phoenix dactylifera]